MFLSLKDVIPTTIIIPTHTRNIVKSINKNSTLGEQIKYYRRRANIKQTDLSLKLGYSRDALRHIENEEMKLVDINLIKGIIDELNIADKININDDYIHFLLGNPRETIIDLRREMNLTLRSFANMLDVSATSVKRWECGNSLMSRAKFEQLKKV